MRIAIIIIIATLKSVANIHFCCSVT